MFRIKKNAVVTYYESLASQQSKRTQEEQQFRAEEHAMAKAQHQWAEERHVMAKEKHAQVMYHYKIHYILNITYITLHYIT